MKIIPPSSSYSTVSLHEYPLPERNARPVYAIAHKCNDQYDVVQAIHRGFNAIECDLKYDKKSEIMYVNHDDASGMSLEKWLDDTKEVMDSHPTDFALIFLIASSSPTWEAIKVRKFSHRPEKSSEASSRAAPLR